MIGPNLAAELRVFLAEHLPRQQNASPLTILAYRDGLKLLLTHIARSKGTSVDKLALTDVDRIAVLGFLDAVETERGNSVSTRNARLTAIRSFFRSVAARHPGHLEASQQILAIPKKRGDSRVIDYLTVDELDAVVQTIDVATRRGRRDDALVRFMHNTGARIQEALDVRACDLRLESPAHVRLKGKGRKERVCPLWADTAARLARLLAERRGAVDANDPVFTNRYGLALTRFGARYILAKYAARARTQTPTLIKKRVHPHTIRHTTAMHLLQSGVDLNTVRCWLGHASVVTTNRYVEIDLEAKRAAIEGTQLAAPGRPAPAIPKDEILAWLESL